MPTTAHALFESLIHGPLMVGDLPEAARFPHQDLAIPETIHPLNLQQKLGHLYEDALAVLLEATPHYGLLARNLQLQEDAHTTVGELDFLLRDLGSGEIIHLELATKFYLAVETEHGLTLPGPDARDNFFRKLQRLRTHQLLLAQTHRHALPEDYRHQAILTRQLIYGCLFDHLHAREPATTEFLNPRCRRGRWLSLNELTEHFPDETKFEIIPKALWPVPLEFLEDRALDPWTPQSAFDHSLMLRINKAPIPYFLVPSDYTSTCASS